MKVHYRRIGRYLDSFARRMLLFLRGNRQEPTYVFHHLPRCGGTSLRRSIAEKKRVFHDYRVDWGSVYPVRYPTSKLGKSDCLCGHFELDGYHLFQRYPEIDNDGRFRLFTFLRDPLDVAVSNYFYQLKNDQSKSVDVHDYLFSNTNYLARILNVNAENFRERLDRYDFIGIVENYEESLRALSVFLECDGLTLNRVNSAERTESLDIISQEEINKFKEQNSLDYLIYEYAVHKFEVLCDTYLLK